MTPGEYQKKKETLIEILSSLLTEELDESVSHEMAHNIECFTTDALMIYVQDPYATESDNEGLVEYHGDMDNFSSEEN